MKAIILDYGGVIALRKDQPFKPIFPDHQLWSQASKGLFPEDQLWEKISQYNQKPVSELINQMFSERYPNQPLLDYLKEVKTQHPVKLAIINNGLYQMLAKAIQEWQLDKTFDVIVNSAQEKVAKPDPKIFQISLKRIQTQPKNAIFFDDTQKHVDAAAQLGIKSYLYTDFPSFKQQIHQIFSNNN